MKDSTRRRLRRTSACPALTQHLKYVKKDEREIAIKEYVCNSTLEGNSAGKPTTTPASELSGRQCAASLCQVACKQIREYENNVDRK